MAETRQPEGVSREPARSEPTRSGPARRLFFALWPDEAMREAMAHATRKAARACGGRPVPVSNLHVTLAFLGSVPEGRLPELAEAARAAALWPTLANAAASGSFRPPACEGAGLTGYRLELAFDHLEHWRSAQLLCALPAEPSAPAAALARRLRGQLTARGFSPDLKTSWSVGVNTTRPFRPHVTLARKVHRPPRTMEMEPVAWSFTAFVLVDSKTLPEGSVYTVLETFPSVTSFCPAQSL